MSEDVLANLLGSKRTSREVPEPEPAAEVETTLPLIETHEHEEEEHAAALEYEETEYFTEAEAPEASEAEPEAVEEEDHAQAWQQASEPWQPAETHYSHERSYPEPVHQVETRMPAFASTEETAGNSRQKMILAIVAGVVVLGGISAFLLKGLFSSPKPVANFPLQLAVEPQGNGLMNIKWNPQGSTIQQAREGRLVVLEKDQQPRVIALESAQLKIGHVYFQSPAERLEFRLEVIDRTGAKAEESVLALSSGMVAKPADASAPAAQNPATKGPNTPNTPSADGKQEPTQVAAAVEPAQPAKATPRQFTPPTQQAAPQTATPTILQDAPAVVPGGSVVPPGLSLPETANRIQVAAPQAQAKETPAAAKQTKVGGNLQKATLIKKVSPVYPPLAKSARIQGTVRFTATIAKDGSVQNVQLVSGPGMLVQAATDAVKQWVYQPMLLNGEAVEVITQLEVTFALGR